MVNHPEEKSGEENRQAAGQAGKEKNGKSRYSDSAESFSYQGSTWEERKKRDKRRIRECTGKKAVFRMTT